MTRFNHLHVPDQWRTYFTRYPQGYTMLEALFQWINQVDNMVDNQNKLNKTVEDYRVELDDFVAQFDTNLQGTVEDTLSDWQQSGFLDVVIDQALQTQMDNLEDRVDDSLNSVNQQLAQTVKVVNVLTHGVVGDGITDDWIGLQAAISLAETVKRSVYIPAGDYYTSKPLRTTHQETFNYTRGIKIYGDGKNSVIIGENNNSVVDYTTELSEQSLLAIHGSNNIVENLCFKGNNAGIFLGKDPNSTISNSASFNSINNVYFEYVGTPLLLQASIGGVYYNRFENIHSVSSQIAMHFVQGDSTQRNSNRNVIKNFTSTRTWIGLLLEDANGNNFNDTYFETIRGTQALGNRPTQLPAFLDDKKTAIVINRGDHNRFDGVFTEATDWDIYDDGRANSFEGLTVGDDSLEPKVWFGENNSPLYYRGYSWRQYGMYNQASPNLLGSGLTDIVNITRPIADEGFNKKMIDIRPLAPQIESRHASSRAIIYSLGRYVDFHINYGFQINVGEEENNLKIFIPDDINVESVYKKDVSGSGRGLSFPVIVGKGTNKNIVIGEFSNESEENPFIIIPKPSSNWDSSSRVNNISLQLRFSQ